MASSLHRSEARPRVLLVDDEPLLLTLLARLLEEDYEVFQASSARAALELMGAALPFTVVLADYGMPDMDGLQLLGEFARREPNTSRIMMTGRPGLEIAQAALKETGIQRFLCKPFPPADLLEAVKDGVTAHRARFERELETEQLVFSNEALCLLNAQLEERVTHQNESLGHLRRLGIEMNRAAGLEDIARVAARACTDALEHRGVCVQIFDREGGMTECSLGPEMSMRMISEPLVTSAGPIGEITVDVFSPQRCQASSSEQNLLAAIASLTAVAAHNEFRRRELDEAQYATVLALAQLSEQRDQETGKHLERVAAYSRLIAESLARRGLHRELLSARYIEDLERSAPLHDIGKVSIPDSILLKRGKLSPSEWEVMKTHSEIGAETLRNVMRSRPVQSYLVMGLDVVLSHHEQWDGSGYPAGLACEAIPLAARIVALADVYDALTAARPYRGAWRHAEALVLIAENRGAHFDPDVVDAFLARAGEADEIRVRLGDEEDGSRRILGPIATRA